MFHEILSFFRARKLLEKKHEKDEIMKKNEENQREIERRNLGKLAEEAKVGNKLDFFVSTHFFCIILCLFKFRIHFKFNPNNVFTFNIFSDELQSYMLKATREERERREMVERKNREKHEQEAYLKKLREQIKADK